MRNPSPWPLSYETYLDPSKDRLVHIAARMAGSVLGSVPELVDALDDLEQLLMDMDDSNAIWSAYDRVWTIMDGIVA